MRPQREAGSASRQPDQLRATPSLRKNTISLKQPLKARIDVVEACCTSRARTAIEGGNNSAANEDPVGKKVLLSVIELCLVKKG
ncbi:hypothetical protein M569_00024 [Genlisea aurea]|uniref:Uncharacterized protein n=1 Tax=Genlisea aurea TaxID=192259 RepID=S8D4Q7_9LAMI|nr:hypothetical protein M569_00024 [Genlisea aurea]